jgi:bla regulator protein blaR1
MSFTYALGWTLLHSLWQGLILAVLALVALRLIPSRYSSVRYLVTTATLALMLVAGVGTFILLLSRSGVDTTMSLQAFERSATVLIADHTPASPGSWVDRFYSFIQAHLQPITLMWALGVLFFSLRIAGGFWYLSRIRQQAVPVDGAWAQRLQQLGARMGLDRFVMLAESAQVQAPMVIGYFKPLILIPVGMIGGLTTEQLETILLHELSHIRRADYLVNIIQSFIEAFFFFNPFVWIVSAMVRTEREHCCDDAVVQQGNALAYAHALASVEALRLNNTGLALSLAGNKNQLLKRIKRIMEKSVQHYSMKERIVPIVLLVVGLACASWMTLKPEQRKASENASGDKGIVVADTTKPGVKPAKSRKLIIRVDENGKEHEQVIENFDVDVDEEMTHEERAALNEALEHMVISLRGIDIPHVEFHEFEAPLMIPNVEFHEFEAPVMIPMLSIEPMEPMAPIEMRMPPIPTMPDIVFWNGSDTVMPGNHSFHYSTDGAEDWNKFSNEFQARFKEQFADFYKKHGPEMEAMMKEMAKQYEHNFEYTIENSRDHFYDGPEREHRRAEFDRERAELDRKREESNRETMKYADEAMREVQALSEQHAKRAEQRARNMEENIAKFDQALKAELIKDGYIKADETVDSIKWQSDGDIVINGKKIKDKDKARYHAIHDKFFKEPNGSVEE